MVSLLTQRDFRAVQNLPFCYLCGKKFADGDNINSDHVPPENIFEKKDRMPLKLLTHYNCNHAYRDIDEKIGQVIALRRGQVPALRNRKLKITYNLSTGQSALTNLDIEDAVWRWIRGFHAALYHHPFPPDDPAKGYRSGALQTPFHRTFRTPHGGVLRNILPQHRLCVQIIKENRAKNNLDRLVSNNGKLVYECVWREGDGNAGWVCMFALNICDWKDLGAVPGLPSCGCAGIYLLPSRVKPETATLAITLTVTVPNLEPLDPFGR
jgi:hypothetical protein